MKIFVISDIHGCVDSLDKALDLFKKEEASYILILGDILYHGPRNKIPKGYNPSEVAKKLNTYKDKIIAVRGNCDSEVDQMMLEFPIMSDYTTLFLGNKRVFASHGHLFNSDSGFLNENDIFISGHTHIPLGTKKGMLVFNPGSITLPKEGNLPSYGILTSNSWEIKDFSRNVFKSIEF